MEISLKHLLSLPLQLIKLWKSLDHVLENSSHQHLSNLLGVVKSILMLTINSLKRGRKSALQCYIINIYFALNVPVGIQYQLTFSVCTEPNFQLMIITYSISNISLSEGQTDKAVWNLLISTGLQGRQSNVSFSF